MIFFLFLNKCVSQTDSISVKTSQQDSIKKAEFLRHIGNGYFPTKYINIDLRYLIKYNQYEGFRTGLGGITNKAFSDKFRLQGYTVYGFVDGNFKYSFGGGFRVSKKTNTWINLTYTEDLQETGSSNFLTDKRFFQFFEPRLINIDLFHKHISKTISVEHQLHPKMITETQFGVSKITPTYNYTFNLNSGESFTNYNLTLFKTSMQWNPFSEFKNTDNGISETKVGYPKFTLQYTKSLANVFSGDLNFSKVDFRAIQKFTHKKNASTEFVLTTGMTSKNTPLTHMYHAYPNNVNKETIWSRFSVAGTNSFETMYFNEFFSDTFSTLQIKHAFSPFNISPWFKPQLVLISRFAIGTMKDSFRHNGINFSTLDKGFTESGLELNKLFFGFGLSFAYRYGAYHLPNFEDNIAVKFTFNISLD
ncbi:hypothetical protein [Pontimicrobium aquaticum]|uniref:hypothetical protein n=1 Tax=Pontimicrobium aquaticum TaxID=2565367 RepID=UPI001EF0980F|nr:hypothetical protein [Pontimicrobium aquaticum]